MTPPKLSTVRPWRTIQGLSIRDLWRKRNPDWLRGWQSSRYGQCCLATSPGFALFEKEQSCVLCTLLCTQIIWNAAKSLFSLSPAFLGVQSTHHTRIKRTEHSLHKYGSLSRQGRSWLGWCRLESTKQDMYSTTSSPDTFFTYFIYKARPRDCRPHGLTWN